MKKKFFNPELNQYDYYTEVWLPETVTVKDEKDILVINHYWKDKDGDSGEILIIQWKMCIVVLWHIDKRKVFNT
ncbi:hypothetical protein [Lactobacillus helveticus]|uniref:hypothetical protein n=1 Tax=Lactobacillus helveticus TaxID=1587 RepID=UPI00110878C7|nr:hypothetical protein [Lactobacillus helveticus]TLQ19706.1 hypothetical protein FEZ38_09510 [Lactobacillus helveticus]